MINHVYQLIQPKVISVKYEDVSLKDRVIIRPNYMAICHADQRYYQGQRDVAVLNKKLPMALIHECCGTVLYDPTNTYNAGQQVVMIPNIPTQDDPIIAENYAKGSYFLSSGHDGFMRELVDMDVSRVVDCRDVDSPIAAITEFISVGVHAVARFDMVAHERRNRIGVWGDGSLAYVVSSILKERFPKSEIIVVGRNPRKLSTFSFVSETYLSTSIPSNLEIDHAFECCGGEGSYYAIEDIIRYINPQGALVLMGVSENRVAINTRMVLEKGLQLLGCSRSGRADFIKATELLRKKNFQQKMKMIIYEDDPVCCIGDIHRVFTNDVATPFKTVFRWEV